VEPFEHLTEYAAAGKLQTDLMAQIQALTAERDALAAQCAALADLVANEADSCEEWDRYNAANRLREVLANLPAAAAVYLAAQRAMGAHGDPVLWTPALIAWRKSAGLGLGK
jgi:hypothetical protein